MIRRMKIIDLIKLKNIKIKKVPRWEDDKNWKKIKSPKPQQ